MYAVFLVQLKSQRAFPILQVIQLSQGFPGDSVVKGSACQFRRCGFDPWVKEDPLEKEMAIHSSFLA